MKFYISDAFTSAPFGGNTAGVAVLPENSDFPDDILMQNIAAELRYSETAFIRADGPQEFTIRYFTPKGEVDLCGHATIASFGVLRENGTVKDGDICISHTIAGDLNISIGNEVMMDMATPAIVGKITDQQELYRIMTGKSMKMEQGFIPEIVSTGLPDIILPIASVEELNAMKPDMEALSQLSRKLNVTGVHAFAICNDGYTAHVRNFAPLYGINEESATGTANGALIYYLYNYGIVQSGKRCTFLQGEAMGRASEITAIITCEGKVKVGGTSTIIASGELHLQKSCL